VRELGLLLSNTPTQSYDAYWADAGLTLIAEAIAEFRGRTYGEYGYGNLLTSNSGEPEYVNDVFEMRSYCWCDAGWDAAWDRNLDHPHAKGCPPNFLYKKNGLIINWYKHAGRGVTSNMEYPGAKNWFKAVSTCIESIKEYSNPREYCDHMFVTPENKAKGICGRCGISFDEWHG
jgi:hypothetical protein